MIQAARHRGSAAAEIRDLLWGGAVRSQRPPIQSPLPGQAAGPGDHPEVRGVSRRGGILRRAIGRRFECAQAPRHRSSGLVRTGLGAEVTPGVFGGSRGR